MGGTGLGNGGNGLGTGGNGLGTGLGTGGNGLGNGLGTNFNNGFFRSQSFSLDETPTTKKPAVVG